jgi:cytochrome c
MESSMRNSFLLPTLLLLAGTASANDTAARENDPRDQAMIDLAWDSGCFNCHDVHDKIRGPAWVEVARRYRGDDTAFERLVVTVREGGSGNWGDDRMSPNRRVPEEDIRTLVQWLLTLE